MTKKKSIIDGIDNRTIAIGTAGVVGAVFFTVITIIHGPDEYGIVDTIFQVINKESTLVSESDYGTASTFDLLESFTGENITILTVGRGVARRVRKLFGSGKNKNKVPHPVSINIGLLTEEQKAELQKKLLERREKLIERLGTLVGLLGGVAIASYLLATSFADTVKDVHIPVVSQLAAALVLIDYISTFCGIGARFSRAAGRTTCRKKLDRNYELFVVIALVLTIALLIAFNLHNPFSFLIFVKMAFNVSQMMSGLGYLGRVADTCTKDRNIYTLLRGIFCKPDPNNLERKWKFDHQARATMIGAAAAIPIGVVLLFVLPKVALAFLLSRFFPPIIADIIFVIAVIGIIAGACNRFGSWADNRKKAADEAAKQKVVEVEEEKNPLLSTTLSASTVGPTLSENGLDFHTDISSFNPELVDGIPIPKTNADKFVAPQTAQTSATKETNTQSVDAKESIIFVSENKRENHDTENSSKSPETTDDINFTANNSVQPSIAKTPVTEFFAPELKKTNTQSIGKHDFGRVWKETNTQSVDQHEKKEIFQMRKTKIDTFFKQHQQIEKPLQLTKIYSAPIPAHP